MSTQTINTIAPNQSETGNRAERAEQMYAFYQSGKSLAKVGEQFGVTRQSVFGIFSARGWPLRKKKTLPFVTFNGRKYTQTNYGYYRRTLHNSPGPHFLHRDVWEHHNGPIPAGYDIHHKDEDKENNDISNLECLPKGEHTRRYSPHNNQFTRGQKKRNHPVKHCVQCGERLVPRGDKGYGPESPSAMKKRNFCTMACAYAWMRGRRLADRNISQPEE